MSEKIEKRFTKGPWEVRGNAVFRSDTHNSVAVVTVYKPDMSEKSEAALTTKLISCAPELYDMLEEFISCTTIQQYQDLIKPALQLLAKATTI